MTDNLEWGRDMQVRIPDCIENVKPFMRLYEMEYPVLDLVKHANQHFKEVVRLHEIAHNTWNLSKHIELMVKMAQWQFGIRGSGVGIASHSM